MKIKGLKYHFVFILLAASLWGTAGIFVRNANAFGVLEMQLVFGRALFTSILIGLIILFKNKSCFKVKLKDLWLFLAAGLFSVVLFNFSYYKTMSLSSLSVAAVLLYTAPFFVVIISRFLFGEKFTASKCAACVIAFIGCAMVSGLFDLEHRIGTAAVIFGLLTGFGYALYTIFSELLLKRGYGTLTITFYVFLSATVCSVPFINLSETVKVISKSPAVLGILFLMALFNTVIPYMLYTSALKGVDPSVAPIIATLEPVVATVIGTFVFGESITLFGIIGIVLVLTSIVILNGQSKSATANAKINLILSVEGKREDGYHLIDTVMQSVTLGDSVKVSKCRGIKIKCGIKELENDSNIAVKAAKLFFETTGTYGGVKIVLKKWIPAAAGLGGGSADAAAVLLLLDKLYNTSLSEETLLEMALKLGADVPFFIKGGTYRAEGIGEVLTPLKSFKGGYFLLAKADSKPSTKEMYARLDSEEKSNIDVNGFVNALNKGDKSLAVGLMENSFSLVWKNNSLQKRLLEFSPVTVSLSGSGPTNFAYFEDKRLAKKALKELKRENIEAYLTKPCEKAIIFE